MIHLIVSALSTDGILTKDANEILVNILNVIYFLTGVVAVFVIILSAVTFSASAGDADRVKKAKNNILYSVIGIVIISLAFVITNYVIGRV
jgi:heme/copper-type cytochrome/quinol oxidase subunit 2